mgnify:FL=1
MTRKNNELTLTTPEGVLEAIGAKDFRSISKKQLLEFCSQIPNMDPKVALACIEQFPKFADSCRYIIDSFERSLNTVLQDDQLAQSSSIQAYQAALESLQERAKDPALSIEESRQLAMDMVDIGDKIYMLYKDHQAFADSLHKRHCVMLVTVVLALGSAIGIKFLENKK